VGRTPRHARTDEECHVWNRFIAKLAGATNASHVLPSAFRKAVSRQTDRTLIDHIEFDEGRDLCRAGLEKI